MNCKCLIISCFFFGMSHLPTLKKKTIKNKHGHRINFTFFARRLSICPQSFLITSIVLLRCSGVNSMAFLPVIYHMLSVLDLCYFFLFCFFKKETKIKQFRRNFPRYENSQKFHNHVLR